MKNQLIKISFLMVVITTVFQSCSDDDVNTIVEESEESVVFTDATTQLIYDWNELWLELDRFTNGMRPNATARALGYIHLAAYETAVTDMAGYTSNEDRLEELNIDFSQREDNVDLNLALNIAYAEAFDHFMFNISPNARGDIFDLRDEKTEELSQNLSQSERENSRQWGRHVARRVIAYSRTDEAAEDQIINQTPDDYVAPVGDGLWVADEGEVAWFPYWGQVRTFVISPSETTSVPFPTTYSTDTSSAYYATMNEVNVVATTAAAQNNEDLWIAEFWSDDVEGLMMSPPGRQISIAIQFIANEDLTHEQSLELLLRLGFAINDAAVSTWDDKYTYNTERPSTYINEYINADFETNLARLVIVPNPSFPGYPSGHATFASAAAGVFIDQFGTDSIDFTDRSHEGRTEFIGTPRSFSSFSTMAEENAYSRVPLGVHIQEDADEGLRLGYEISTAVNNFNLF
ncbi:vanadium-dependent haloperoxidase [Lacinutrix chionoecetis]